MAAEREQEIYQFKVEWNILCDTTFEMCQPSRRSLTSAGLDSAHLAVAKQHKK